MPRFEVRLEDPDSQHFRLVTLNGRDLTKEAARAYCEEREERYVEASLGTDDLKAAKARNDRGALAIHAQSKPYRVKYVKEA